MIEFPRDRKNGEPAPKIKRTPAEQALLSAAGPTFIDAAEFGTPESDLAAAIEPDDWRLYYLMRDLAQEDRSQILALAELLYNLRYAQRWAVNGDPT